MNKKFTILAASILLATAFIFSCSSGGDGPSGGGDDKVESGALTIKNLSEDAIVVVIDYQGEVRDMLKVAEITADAIAGGGPESSPVPLMNMSGGKFNSKGIFAVSVSTMEGKIRYFEKVSFNNGGAIVDWNQNYWDPVEGYVPGSSSSGGGKPTSSSSGTSGGGTGVGLVLPAGQAWVNDNLPAGDRYGYIFQSNNQVQFIVDWDGFWEILDTESYTATANQLTVESETVTYIVVGNTLTFAWPDGAEVLTKMSVTIGGGGVSSSSGGGTTPSSSSSGGAPWTSFCNFGFPTSDGHGGCYPYDGECDLEYGSITSTCADLSGRTYCNWGPRVGGEGGCWDIESTSTAMNACIADNGELVSTCPSNTLNVSFFCYWPANHQYHGDCDKIGSYALISDCVSGGGAIVKRDFCLTVGADIYGN
ncbi:MAG: hypothetical protein LBU89_09870 [Fibromonadaceae bacterium]|jgi:hypothetical protein|nr:hypothetical protein [Fibromonadaceae bacterium]